MSIVPPGTPNLDYVDTGDSYSYPNLSSYAALRTQGASLYRGTLWGIGVRSTQIVTPGTVGQYDPLTSQPISTPAVTREILPMFYKRFQYNPADINMQMNAVAVDPTGSEQDGGNYNASNMGMGALTMDIKLNFTRDEEVYRAETGQGGARMNSESLAVYKRIGVQKDIYDIFRVILNSTRPAGSTNANGSAPSSTPIGAANDQSLPSDMTLSALTGKAFDLATSGSYLLMKPVAIQTSDDAVFYGNITAFNVSYTKFNHRMVPVWAKVALGLDVMNVRPSSSPPSSFVDTTSPAGGGGGSGGGGAPSVAPQTVSNGSGRGVT